ncbi:hypothetical protein HUG10_06555 [Halorarum halophilum]|uniref:Uncharacterized protein n=1 Tax=Halorarum halophilum TaxID=2743090 RepID=A0A7D5L2P5_9EURY|nr:hypothetical protein [Halobaculum halophilum]QLG27223.1 hypothetical protein HUG10_06555 [Halobaculum halophilum]
MTGGLVFHVVCRECPTESLRQSAAEAETLATAHASDTDHSVAVERIE